MRGSDISDLIDIACFSNLSFAESADCVTHSRKSPRGTTLIRQLRGGEGRPRERERERERDKISRELHWPSEQGGEIQCAIRLAVAYFSQVDFASARVKDGEGKGTCWRFGTGVAENKKWRRNVSKQ